MIDFQQFYTLDFQWNNILILLFLCKFFQIIFGYFKSNIKTMKLD